MFRFIKRLLDIIISASALLFSSPILLVLIILVRNKLGSPVFFHQLRPGHYCKPFTMYKFRTMISKTHDDQGNQLSDEARLPAFGRWLRSTSLDELPELWNVLKGDMSLVGPRPLMMKYLDRYTPEQNRRHEAKPGITGWAQINGRNTITWEQKFKYDVWYVDNRSLWLDLKILCITFFQVFKRSDINKEGHVTVDEFMGTSIKKDASE